MATAAQIDANRRNSKRSTGPVTPSGKNRSRLNALVHGCLAEILVLPTEDPDLFEDRSRAWRLSLKPRNPAEEYMVNRMASLAWKGERIDRAQMAQLNKRVHHAGVDAANTELEHVISLGKRLLGGKSVTDENARGSNDPIDGDDPMHFVLHLQTTVAGCQWMLDQWANLRTVLERDVPWVGADTGRAVRLLGHKPLDVLDNIDVARLYLASHVLLNQGGEPFQNIIDELPPAETPSFRQTLQLRRYEVLAPEDAAAARQALMEIVGLATEQLQMKMEVLSQIAELDAASAADRASWDDSPEGERLRRYEITCSRTWLRMFELLLKTRSAGEELDFDAIASIERIAPARNTGENVSLAPAVANVVTPTAEPAKNLDPPIEVNPVREIPPNEANRVREIAPNEANSDVQAPSSTGRDGHKDFRIDTPHLDRNAGGFGITGKETMHPALHRVLTGRQSTLLDLSGIFDGR
jgi:hypothetical protein